MHSTFRKAAICLVACAVVVSVRAGEPSDASVSNFEWLPERLIPNEYGLQNGTWSDQTILQCLARCEADSQCSGFSVEKTIGVAWAQGCEGGACLVKTECHAKGLRGSDAFWLPSDSAIRVPAVDARSNAWIGGWGTLLKKQD